MENIYEPSSTFLSQDPVVKPLMLRKVSAAIVDCAADLTVNVHRYDFGPQDPYIPYRENSMNRFESPCKQWREMIFDLMTPVGSQTTSCCKVRFFSEPPPKSHRIMSVVAV